MTFSQPPPLSAGRRPQLPRIAWLLPLLASPALAVHAPPFVLRPAQAAARSSLPYLAAADPVAMRFAPPMPDPVVEPRLAAAAPPVPGGPSEEIAAANRGAQLPPEPSRSPAETAMPATEFDATVAPPETANATPPDRPPAPVALLPDDLRREIRPEDVLPFFQPPGGNFILAVPPPASAPAGPALPPSSATYRQQ
ncbi:MAG TPA: hypothetical protein VGD81_15930 [Opitutaceae bacterium]